MKKILVTGGAGFIGSNLCEELVKASENKVVSLDNYSSGLTSNHVDGVTYIAGSTSDIGSLVNFSPDIVYHLGEYARVEQSFHDLDAIRTSNVEGTFAVLEFCKQHGSKIVYAGSSTKFGDNGAGRFQSPYSLSKAANADLVRGFGQWFGLEYAITYFYNAYGPREIKTGKYATLIALFTEKMRLGEDLTVVSPGTQRRYFTHVKDIVSGLILVAEKGLGDNYGIGSNERYSVLEVAELFGGKITMIPERLGNRMEGDLVVAETLDLGWNAKYNLKRYIKTLECNSWECIGG